MPFAHDLPATASPRAAAPDVSCRSRAGITVRRPPADSSQDGAARSHLHGGDAPAVEHHEPVAVPAAQDAVIFGEGRDDSFHDLLGSASSLVVGDIQVLAANEAHAQNDLRHGHAP